jgi:hypothetical protein
MMDNISELVNEHPFDKDLQNVFLGWVKRTQSLESYHEARKLSLQFVDYDDEAWIEWIETLQEYNADFLGEILFIHIIMLQKNSLRFKKFFI